MKIQEHEHEFTLIESTSGDGWDYFEIEFRGIPVWDGICMKWRFVVHKSGSFPNEDIQEYEGKSEEYIWKEVELKDVMAYPQVKNDLDKDIVMADV